MGLKVVGCNLLKVKRGWQQLTPKVHAIRWQQHTLNWVMQ